MSIVKLIEYLRDRLPVVIKICYGILVFFVVLDIFVDKSHAHTLVEHFPGFWSIFGFIACVILIFVAKWFGHSGIMTREDYYDK